MGYRPYYNTTYGASIDTRRSGNETVAITRPEITTVFSAGVPQQTLNSQRSLSAIGIGPLRRLDVSAKVNGPPHKSIPSPGEMERRLAYLQAKQNYYDNYAVAPRNIPQRISDEHQFIHRLDDVMHGNELTQRAAHKVAMHEAMLRQKAHTRHFDWTKRVYEPINQSIVNAVDQKFETIHNARQQAMTGYLAATATRNVYLDDLVKKGDYDPYSLNRTNTIKTKIKVLDPLKRVVEKTWEELELVHRPTYRTSRSKDVLSPRLWTKEAMEALPHGHFEAKDLAGGIQMAFAGKDNESSLRFMDYDENLPYNPQTGRQPDLDNEFPKGKRMTYPYRFQDSTHTVSHPNITKHIYGNDDKFTDNGGTRLDTTIADVMKNAK